MNKNTPKQIDEGTEESYEDIPNVSDSRSGLWAKLWAPSTGIQDLPIGSKDVPNILAIKLSNQMDKNAVFSPLSITFALALIHLGAEQNTDKELANLFNYKYNISELASIYNTFNNNIIKMANCIIINNNFEINKQYTNSIKNFTLIEENNFKNKSNVVNKVNKYISQNTNGLIKNVLDTNDINDLTILILINTIYFKASWLHKFNAKNTEKAKFGNTQKLVDMMYINKKFNYYENDNMQLLEMFYKNKDYVMGISLPKNDDYKFDLDTLMSNIDSLKKEKVEVYLPKFTHRKRVDMIPILESLGVHDLFTKNAKLNISQDSYISSIIHEAVVIVDEEGTEAAAVTTMISQNCMMSAPKKTIIFRADHDFVYYIRHIPSNMILFYGEFCNM